MCAIAWRGIAAEYMSRPITLETRVASVASVDRPRRESRYRGISGTAGGDAACAVGFVWAGGEAGWGQQLRHEQVVLLTLSAQEDGC
jgi:hypothetical protein